MTYEELIDVLAKEVKERFTADQDDEIFEWIASNANRYYGGNVFHDIWVSIPVGNEEDVDPQEELFLEVVMEAFPDAERGTGGQT